MTEWEPATDAEIAMRNALRTDDQESYFRILAGVDLLLPVSADALAGLAPLGWGTWSTGGRTHVLAFTSPSALQACLADYTGSARRVAYAELADTWPNLEWWLAVNPGLPIEGYLPAWFVAQLSRGDLRLPTRGPGREGSNAPNRIQDLHAAATLAATAAAQGYKSAGQNYAGPGSGGPIQGDPAPGGGGSGAGQGGSAAGGSGYGAPGSGGPAYGGAGSGGQGAPSSGGPASGSGAPGAGGPAYGGAASGGPGGPVSAGRAASAGSPSSGVAAPSGAQAYAGSPSDRRPSQDAAPAATSGADAGSGAPVGPGGLPLRTPGAVLPSGLPSRVPGTPAGSGGDIPGGQFNGFGTSSGGRPAQPGGPSADQPGDRGRPGPEPSSGGAMSGPGGAVSARSGAAAGQGSATSDQHDTTLGRSGAPAGQAGAVSARAGGLRPAGGAGGDVPAAYQPPTLPPSGGPTRPAPGSSALSALGSRTPGALTTPTGSTPSAPPPLQRPDSPLPTRTPMAQTPPLPAHIPPPADTDDVPAGPGEAGAISAKSLTEDQSAGPGGLPRRQVTSPDERPPSMAAAAQALAGRTSGSTQEAPATAQPGLAPPVIPGAGGAGRSSAGPAVPAAAARPTVPPATSAPGSTPQPPDAPSSRPDSEPTDQATGQAPTDQGARDRRTTDQGATDQRTTDEDTAGHGLAAQGPADQGTGPETDDFEDDFVPANEVERDLYYAVSESSTDSFLSTLLLATVLVPVAHNSRPGSAPGESGFAFRTEEIDGERFLVVFTSRDRLAEHFAEPTRTVGVRFVDLIRNWPDPAWSFAVNPTSPIGAKYPGPQVIALAAWAVEAGLGGDPVDAPAEQPQRPAEPTAHLTIMQKAVPAEQIDYYLERGYDRVAGFVHRAGELEHVRSPGELFSALGLLYDGSPYQGDAKEAFVLRWAAHRPSLYRIPYGGQSEQALRAMDGWVIERPPFRGNGFAPGEGKDVIAEFKVDSVRLPHGAQLWRMDADGAEQMIAVFDCDAPVWRRVGDQ